MAKTTKTTPKARRTQKTKPVDEGRIAEVAKRMHSLPAGVTPPVLGSRMRIWKQDPSVAGINVRDAYIHTRVHEGPGDSQILIKGLPTVFPDANGDFLFEPTSEQSFDAVHTYAVVRQVLTLYQRLLEKRVGWQWDPGDFSGTIDVFPQAGETANAFYSRRERALKFFFFTPFGSNEPVFTCRSLDIVAHECGHAVLDALKPDWIRSFEPQTGGLHESFGDLTSIFLTLSQMDQVEYIIAETKADLHQKNVLAEVAEQFGNALGRPTGLRDADNNLKLSEVSNEVHDISKVFTGAIYDILADAFSAARRPRHQDDALTLYNVGRKIAALTLRAIEAAPARNATFSDVADEMLSAAAADPANFPNYDTFIRNQFEVREVIGPSAIAGPKAITGMAPNRLKCCGTMQALDYENES